MRTSFMNESPIESRRRSSQLIIESPSIWNDLNQAPNLKKQPIHNNASKTVDAQITYTETIFIEKGKFLTNYPELNIAALRLEKLSYQIGSMTLHTTFALLAKLFDIAQKNNLWWSLPLINIGFDSEVIFEWWHDDRKLDFDISNSSINYMKVWGADIDNDMEDGSTTINESYLTSLWKWIAS